MIRIRVGTNATGSGTGSNRVVNPASYRKSFLTIGGTFGDFGSIVLPMKSSSSAISVTATVESSGGGGGGGGGGNEGNNSEDQNQADSTPPVVSQVIVSLITKSSASISWTTNEDANSKINYGLTNAFELGMVFDVSLTKSHSVSLFNLQESSITFRSKQRINRITSRLLQHKRLIR